MEPEFKILTDLGFLLFLAVLLTTNKLWTKGQVDELRQGHLREIKVRDDLIFNKDKEVEYWRGTSLRLLEVGEKIAEGSADGRRGSQEN